MLLVCVFVEDARQDKSKYKSKCARLETAFGAYLVCNRGVILSRSSFFCSYLVTELTIELEACHKKTIRNQYII